MKRILCPFHKEQTPSCMLYEDGFFCHGCGKHGPLTELKNVEVGEIKDPEPEDLERTLRYVDRLSKRSVRGLEFPADRNGYFVVWPDRSYYKYRFFDDKKPKYLGTTGHYKGPFWARKEGNKTLVIVEGEINALSIAKACPEYDVMSPGGSGDFNANRVKRYLKSIRYYEILLIIADADKAGALACIEMMGALAHSGQTIRHHLMQPDANEVLCEKGQDGLREKISSIVAANMDRSTGEGHLPN